MEVIMVISFLSFLFSVLNDSFIREIGGVYALFLNIAFPPGFEIISELQLDAYWS